MATQLFVVLSVFWENVRYKMNLLIPALDDDCIMAFEICGNVYKLSEYDKALNENHTSLSNYYMELTDFPYTIRDLTNGREEKIRNAPIFILYRGERISIYNFLKKHWNFEKQLPLSTATNGLEVHHSLELSFKPFQTHDNYHAVIRETFRVIQDLHFLISSARWALIQAHRILHFRSGLLWGNGWEQLWTRSTWLNNAIIMYDSCFDKLTQVIWIGTESYTKKVGLSRASLCNLQELEELYKKCWHRDDIPKKMPEPYKSTLANFRCSKCGSSVANYANKIKHRGGMRYDGLFPFGQISFASNGYNPHTTRDTNDIDDVVNILKMYHIELTKTTDTIIENIIETFKQHGYLTGEDIVL